MDNWNSGGGWIEKTKPESKWLEKLNPEPETYFAMTKLGFAKYFDAEAWAEIERLARGRIAGGKRPIKDVLKTVEGHKQAIRKKQAVAALASHLSRRGDFKAWYDNNRKRGFARWYILAAFEPGAWYALSDIIKLSGVIKHTVKGKMHNNLVPEGLVEKGDNPDWYDRRDQYGFRIWGDNPRSLYKLTDKGVAARVVAREELAARGWPKYVPDKKHPPAPSEGEEGELT